MKNPRQQKGFSLIELLIVIAIIGIIASIVVVYLVQAKQAAKGASAVSSMRLIHSCETTFRSSKGRFGDLTELGNANLITDSNLAAGQKSGYNFIATPDPADPAQSYEATAAPTSDPNNEWQHYFIDASGVLRYAMGAPADASSPPVN